jgi:hypothetical protein
MNPFPPLVGQVTLIINPAAAYDPTYLSIRLLRPDSTNNTIQQSITRPRQEGDYEGLQVHTDTRVSVFARPPERYLK